MIVTERFLAGVRTMGSTEITSWKSVRDELIRDGWKVGWAEYEDEYQESVWLVQALRSGRAEMADGFSLFEAIEKVYCLTR